MDKKIIYALILAIPLSLFSGELTIIAHRGNSDDAPENTLSAFQSAAYHGIPFLECDIHLSKDGIPVITHDRILVRTTDNRYPIAIEDLSLAQIKTLDSGFWFDERFSDQKIPTLSELLTTPLNEIGLMLEIKEGSASNEKIATVVVNELFLFSTDSSNRQILIGSKSPEILKHVKQLAPNQPTIAIIEKIENINQHRPYYPDQYAMDKKLISDTLISDMHRDGKKIWIWTVNEPDEMTHFMDMHVDGMITNRPKVLKRLLR